MLYRLASYCDCVFSTPLPLTITTIIISFFLCTLFLLCLFFILSPLLVVSQKRTKKKAGKSYWAICFKITVSWFFPVAIAYVLQHRHFVQLLGVFIWYVDSLSLFSFIRSMRCWPSSGHTTFSRKTSYYGCYFVQGHRHRLSEQQRCVTCMHVFVPIFF